jgi:hypothetical protein
MAPMPFDETPLETPDNATSDSWFARLIACIAWLFDAITRLKRVKRTTRFKGDWRDHFDRLRACEWQMHQMLAQGAALLLSGKTLDDADFVQLPMPANYGGPCPRTPFAMNCRFLKLAQFMRDPEFYIRRHAARIAKHDPRAAHGSTDAAVHAAAHHEAVAAAQSPNTHKQLTLMVSSAQRAHPSNHAGALRSQLNARGPPQRACSQLPVSLFPQKRQFLGSPSHAC